MKSGAFIGAVVSAVIVVGCNRLSEGDPFSDGKSHTVAVPPSPLGIPNEELLGDYWQLVYAEEAFEMIVEEPLSGAPALSPGEAPYGDWSKVQTSPPTYFGGCIETTLSGYAATHLFNDCKRYGLAGITGTVQSTYTFDRPGVYTIKHEVKDFRIHGATFTGSRTIAYAYDENMLKTIAKQRTGTLTGMTMYTPRPFVHEMSFTEVYTLANRTVARDGKVTGSVDGRALVATISGYTRHGCAESGTIALQRTAPDGALSLTVDILGPQPYQPGWTVFDATTPDGSTRQDRLECPR